MISILKWLPVRTAQRDQEALFQPPLEVLRRTDALLADRRSEGPLTKAMHGAALVGVVLGAAAPVASEAWPSVDVYVGRERSR
jgi:hypothetical protein